MSAGKIVKVSGPLVVAENIPGLRLYDTVWVGHKRLLGEIIEVRQNLASIQVYEDTSSMGIGEPVVSLLRPLSIELGPGLLSSTLDGIGRNLQRLADETGAFLQAGVSVNTLDEKAEWDFISLKEAGEELEPYEVIGYVMEYGLKHWIRNGKHKGKLESIVSGKVFTYDEVASVNGMAIKMVEHWPVRKRRPFVRKLAVSEPLITGQRIIDSLFPVMKGGAACVPGPFGSGKTVVQHQLAKWAECDGVIYIGCGERGNEMTDVLNEFPSLMDPKTERPLMEKMVLIANTSNMPVAAREASIYTGMSIAEYYRDMGYDIALMADSTSRWAEALREMSGRLEEMPGDEGYPAYLGSRLAELYERSGLVKTLGKPEMQGSVTMIGAVSPAGGDLSEPVTQATLRVAKVFWALDASLAYERHFPAINWDNSYSLYQDKVDEVFNHSYDKKFSRYRHQLGDLLREEKRLLEIAMLVGKDTLSDQDLLKLLAARIIREDFLSQNAFVAEDTYTPIEKQIKMMRNICVFYHQAKDILVHEHVFLADIENMKCLNDLARMKMREDQDLILKEMMDEFNHLKGGRLNA